MANEDDIVDMISEALYLYEAEYEVENPDEQLSTRTYAEVGMLTSNSGLVLRIGDEEYQITVIKR